MGNGARHVHFDRLDAQSRPGCYFSIAIAVDPVRQKNFTRSWLEARQCVLEAAKSVARLESRQLVGRAESHLLVAEVDIRRSAQVLPRIVAEHVICRLPQIGCGRRNPPLLELTQAGEPAKDPLDDVVSPLVADAATNKPKEAGVVGTIERLQKGALPRTPRIVGR